MLTYMTSALQGEGGNLLSSKNNACKQDASRNYDEVKQRKGKQSSQQLLSFPAFLFSAWLRKTPHSSFAREARFAHTDDLTSKFASVLYKKFP